MLLTRCRTALTRFLRRGKIGWPSREGFTLVEILMVMMILSMGRP